MKRKKMELTITVMMYLGGALLSSLLSIMILRYHHKLIDRFFLNNIFLTAILPLMFAVLIALTLTQQDGKYAFRNMNLWECFLRSVFHNLFIGGMWAAVLLLFKNGITDSRYYFVTTLAINVIVLAALIYIVQKTVISYFYKTASASLCAILTTRMRAPVLTDRMKKDWDRRIQGISLVDGAESCEDKEIDHVPVVCKACDFVTWVREHALDEVFVIVDDLNAPLIVDAVYQISQMGVLVTVNLTAAEQLENDLNSEKNANYIPKTEKQLSYFGETPVLTIGPRQFKMRYMALKRVMDICGGLVGLAICAVLFIFVAPAILLESPGPIFFAQERIGKNGRKFRMYKFRSMYKDAEARKKELLEKNEMSGLMFKMKDDPRITKVGKFIRKTSIDEFPQFFNVLKGDMSLVGTRPPTVGEFEKYSNYHKRRLSMKPGITGMWQATGRSDITDFEEIVKLDCRYIDNWSLRLDIYLLWKTVFSVLEHKGAQ